jgi:hypothetical protein
MCQLIETRVRTDKGFKEVDLNQVAKYLQEFTGMDVSGQQVYNHLRKWRQRWMRVAKLRELSGALWVDDACMISLDDEHYLGHIKVCQAHFICFIFSFHLFHCCISLLTDCMFFVFVGSPKGCRVPEQAH